MSGPGKPMLLAGPVPFGAVRLSNDWAKQQYEEDLEDYADDPGARGVERPALYVATVWARATEDGWVGWLRKEHMTSQPMITWLKGMWYEVE